MTTRFFWGPDFVQSLKMAWVAGLAEADAEVHGDLLLLLLRHVDIGVRRPRPRVPEFPGGLTRRIQSNYRIFGNYRGTAIFS